MLGKLLRQVRCLFGNTDKSKDKHRGARVFRRASSKARTSKSNEFGPARLLSTSPPVFLTGIARGEDLGIARAFGRAYGDVQAGFIVFPTWSIERPGRSNQINNSLTEHLALYPRHKFRFICNTPREAEMMSEVGLSAEFLNKNFMVSDEIFCPLDGASAEFDAVYVARFMPVKRHELAAQIPRVGYVAYVQPTGGEDPKDQFRELCDAALARNSDHVLLNRLRDGLPINMSHAEVNAAINRAAVGLILSEVEGSSYASMEYLLAGVPVVSTPSIGGRDIFFDPEFCLVCEPDPASVGNAVSAIRARNIPRDIIRARTLAKIAPERRRFLSLVDELIEELGGEARYSAGEAWPFGDISGVPWRYYREHLEAFGQSERSELAVELGLPAAILEGVQLQARELRPIVAAIKERPNCSLLVFGCGRDTLFWEAVNREGATTFLEDNPGWASRARASVTSATVHLVTYDTKLPDWRQLLDSPAKLVLDLPEEISARRWDVILVNGPAGHNDAQTGRMKSIFAASRLVAPGGCVFVHDCQRPAEEAFASRYLGDSRVFIQVKGRALLKGYAF